MKTMADILHWLLQRHPWIKEFEIYQWSQIMVIYDNSKCKLCSQVIPAGEAAMMCKGTGIVHQDTCFEELCEWAQVRDNAEIAFRQTVFNNSRSVHVKAKV